MPASNLVGLMDFECARAHVSDHVYCAPDLFPGAKRLAYYSVSRDTSG